MPSSPASAFFPAAALPAAFALLLSACAAPADGGGGGSMGSGSGAARGAGPAGSAASALTATDWVARDLDGTPPLADRPVTLRLDADTGRLTAQTGCNRVSGGWRLEGGERLRVVPPLVSTRMACPPEQTAQEARVVNLLSAVERYAIEPDGTLVLSTERGAAMRFAPQPRGTGRG